MKVAIHGKSFGLDSLPKIESLFRILAAKKIHVVISDGFFEIVNALGISLDDASIYKPGALGDVDLLISLGGDGTLLESVTHVAKKEIPVLGINMGRLGFLSNTSLEESLKVLEDILAGDYQVESRMMVKAECSENIFENLNFALNEFAVLKQDTSSMITVHTYLDGDYLNSYWADGLIISTPTGSTGYSLSCGGPIINPISNNFVITPVSPHNLSIRPVVVPDNSIISLEVESRSKYFLVSLDSRSHTVSSGFKFTVKREAFDAKLIKTGKHTFIDTLRQKLHWGLDSRN